MDNDQFSRTRLMLGNEGLNRLQNSFVIIAGLGAVGGYAVEALARAGVGKLRLIDSDCISASNINRQIYALHSTIGQEKSKLAKQRVLDINPDCHVQDITEFINKDSIPHLMSESPDFIIDAIDSLNSKVELISYLYKNNYSFISSLGAARRTDPTKIKIGAMKNVHHCRLGAFLRKRLKRRAIGFDFQCVYSEEPQSLKQNFRLPERTEVPESGRGRVIMGSLPTITGIFGLILANEVLRKLTNPLEKEAKDHI